MSAPPPFFGNAEVMLLEPEDIYVPERIGFLHEDKAVALGRLMAVDGQRDPIKVVLRKGSPKQKWQLVVGRHRLRGAELEQVGIWALEVHGDADYLADLEASENLHRRPLGPIERAKFTAALVQAAQARLAREHGELSQHQLAVKARWDRVRHGQENADGALRDEVEDTYAKMAGVYGWEETVGDALDISKRTIHRDLALYRLLIEPFPDLIEQLSKHPVVGENASQLKLIGQVRDEAARRRVIEALLADHEIGADDARIVAEVDRPAGPAPLPHQKYFNAIEGSWARLALAQKREFLLKIPAMLTAEMKRELRDQLSREIEAEEPQQPGEKVTIAEQMRREGKL
ncbi:MAG: hypothetical protein AAF494_01865 [Pseudomonadota bacterium]